MFECQFTSCHYDMTCHHVISESWVYVRLSSFLCLCVMWFLNLSSLLLGCLSFLCQETKFSELCQSYGLITVSSISLWSQAIGEMAPDVGYWSKCQSLSSLKPCAIGPRDSKRFLSLPCETPLRNCIVGWTHVCHKYETLVIIVCHVNLCSSLVELLLSYSAVLLSYAARSCVFLLK